MKPGDKVAQFDKICEVQSDKAAVEITSRFDGQITKLHYDQGGMAKVGAPLVDIDVKGGEESGESKEIKPKEVKKVVESTKDAPVQHVGNEKELHLENEKVLATPAVRHIAREMKVALSAIKGSGRDGRVMKEDILAFVGGKGAKGSLFEYLITIYNYFLSSNKLSVSPTPGISDNRTSSRLDTTHPAHAHPKSHVQSHDQITTNPSLWFLRRNHHERMHQGQGCHQPLPQKE